MNPNIESFPSPADPKHSIVLNLGANHAHVVREPGSAELIRFLSGFETRTIDAFWEKAVLKNSIYRTGVPYGLSCSAGGHSIFPTKQVATTLGISGERSRGLTGQVHALGFEAMCSALNQLKPKSVSEALQTLTENGLMRFPVFSLTDLNLQLRSFPSLVERLVFVALSKSAQKRFAMACLIAMRAEEWVLLPTEAVQKVGHFLKSFKMTPNEWSPAQMEYLNPVQSLLLRQLEGNDQYKSSAEQASAHVKARFAILCSSITTVHEMSWPFADRILFSSNKQGQAGANLSASSKIRAHWRSLCEANGSAAMVGVFRREFRECIQLRCPEDPRLSEWLDLLTLQCDKQTSGNYEPRYQAFGFWLTWLSTLQNIPGPYDVTRDHIHNLNDPDDNTFRRFLENKKFEHTKNGNRPMARMADVFNDLANTAALQGRKFSNPIHFKVDAFKTPRREVQQGTHRKRLAGWVLDELKKLIVSVDPDKPQGPFRWTDSLKQIGVLWIDRAGESERIFCPILPAIIYLMLEYPLRSHQVRWLDSGELDAVIYDFLMNEFVSNPAHDGETQAYGLLRPAQDGSTTESELPIDFQVAVNKVVLGERKASSFTIPHITRETLWVIQQIREWQARYGAAPQRVKEAHEPTKQKNRNRNYEDFYPDICPLFRYPAQKSYFPPSSQQLNYFWGQLCGQWDQFSDQWNDPKTGTRMRRPGAPILSMRYREAWIVATHDLHSLRVAGVSFLLDAGIPLAVVASIAGHRSIAMTLHYYRADHQQLRLKLRDAYAAMGDNKVWEAVERKLDECQNYESWLTGTPDGFAALRVARTTKIWTISLSGICPGTSCDDGLPKEFARPCGSDVPGSRCALCRFFVCGPPFLPGMVQEFNCLLFELEQRAHRQLQLRADAEELEEQGNFGQLQVLRGEVERLERECYLDIKVLGRLHIVINECFNALNNSSKHAGNNSLGLISTQPGEIKARVEHIGPFDRLKELIEAADCLPMSRHTVPEQAVRMLQDKILFCLRTNGAACFLAGLAPTLARRLTLQFANIIEKFIPDTDQREKLIAGEILLRSLPAAEGPILQAVSKLENQATALSGEAAAKQVTQRIHHGKQTHA